MSTQTITLAGGCFWCLEAVYEQVRGVVAVESGYANGHVPNPSYEQVCSGTTGHAEVVRLEFDPALISLDDILDLFFAIHDPTTVDRQGNDVGPQYRSGIYWSEPGHQTPVQAAIARAQAAHTDRVVTQVEELRNYWRAEDYHQHYFAQHPHQGYCAYVVAPKVQKFHKHFARLRKP